MGIQILVVEDEENICNAVKAFLVEMGYSVDTCFNGNEALERFYNKSYHLVILDIMLPGANGKELLKEFRKISNAPVLMMTALTEDKHQIDAFDSKADDYVTKPFSGQILVRRVEALLRRSGMLQNNINFCGYVLYPEAYKVFYDNAEIALTPKEFEIFLYMVQHKGKVLSYDSLLSNVWGFDYEGDERVIHTYIKNLRSKLPVNIINTVRGVGYSVCEKRQ